MKIGLQKEKKMSNKGWNKDKEKGEEVEKRLVEYLKKKYPKTKKINGKFKDYDIEVPEENKTIEVKNDIGSQDTPNYFIEISCNYENSGLVSTKADYWFIYDEADCIWIRTGQLKALCDIYGIYWKGIPQGSNTIVEAYLMPQDIIKKHADKISKGEVYGL